MGLILAILLPPIGLVVSIIAWRQAKQKSLGGKGMAIFGTVWGGVFTLPFLFFLWLFIAFGGFAGNAAQDASKPVTAEIEQLGSRKLCDNGDSGYGIDNTTPWYNVYYLMPDSPDLTELVKKVAAQHGYNLGVDPTELEKQLNTTRHINSVIEELDQARQNSRETDEPERLVGKNGDTTLKINIYRGETTVPLYCRSDYGNEQRLGDGEAMLFVQFSLPDRNQ